MKKIINNLLQHTMLSNRFFLLLGVMAILLIISYWVPFMFPLAQVAVILLGVSVIVDLLLLFSNQIRLTANRKLALKLSLGDENHIFLEVNNHSNFPLTIQVYDELPFQLQKRDQSFSLHLKSSESHTLDYFIRPTTRGLYDFGNTNLILHSPMGLVRRKYVIVNHQSVEVYPSIIQMKKYALEAMRMSSYMQGEQIMRRVGQSYEFDQIKNYTPGDDYRNVNWKATSKKGDLMVNRFIEEKSQRIYCILDKSRVMKMPFEGLSLLDYAINSSLTIANVALQKQDKAGLISFSDKVGNVVTAESGPKQLNTILRALYNERERDLESNYELLYTLVRKVITNRSLLFLFTNFETMYAMERVLPILRNLNRKHLLVVIFFENKEMIDFVSQHANDKREIFQKTLVEDAVLERKKIGMTLNQYGIQTIITSPENLSINLINQYLTIKKRGLL